MSRANSSIPATTGGGRSGSAMRIRQFSTVAQDSVWCSTPSSRAPADPASATATASTIRRRAGVRR
ncbi:hypothetical protein [Streptomyces viridosporus]|uniref:hypothetical protein n=1 Tax=Streptomyces viridosporus TaxID=67581 RepID=UPI0033336846